MTTMKTIEAALKLVDVKKKNLQKAFEDLQAHSSSLSSFNLSWSDLDSYFTSIHYSLQQKFDLLQSQGPQPEPKPVAEDSSGLAAGVARPELRSLCEAMDGLGLRKYLLEQPSKDRAALRDELPSAMQCAPDAAAMVLEAIGGFYAADSKGDKGTELIALRRTCVMLLEALMGSRVLVGDEAKERARILAAEWKGKVKVEEDKPVEALAFLNLLAAYGLVDEFSVEELVDFAVVSARFPQAIELCRVLRFGDRISDLIPKLLSKGKHLPAIKFIFYFELADKFPAVPILKEYVELSKQQAQEIRKGGKNSRKSQNEAISKEITALRSVIKIIEDQKLESEYPKGILMERIATLEKEKADKKNSIVVPLPKTRQQSKAQKLSGGKRPRTSPAVPSAAPPAVRYAGSSVGIAGSALDSAPYLSSVGGLEGSFHSAALYAAGSSGGLYGSVGTPLGMHGDLTSTQALPYPLKSHIPPSGYLDGLSSYSGYGLPPQHPPAYHPQ
ncbi:truncated FRIGIDA-like protein 1 [Diospyros lotus]|uniref:truncated FRIGIDA-like protein 1 n=1 Tax=Diospyros lotus TaxID=55363 RepID=UPI002256DFE7|nr:truncated FRIGIDA-like protein 1 [Diospyros lotus]